MNKVKSFALLTILLFSLFSLTNCDEENTQIPEPRTILQPLLTFGRDGGEKCLTGGAFCQESIEYPEGTDPVIFLEEDQAIGTIQADRNGDIVMTMKTDQLSEHTKNLLFKEKVLVFPHEMELMPSMVEYAYESAGLPSPVEPIIIPPGVHPVEFDDQVQYIAALSISIIIKIQKGKISVEIKW